MSELNSLGELPSFVNAYLRNYNLTGGASSSSGSGSSLVECMISKHALWHKNCHNAVNRQKAERVLRKVEKNGGHHDGIPMKTCRKLVHDPQDALHGQIRRFLVKH